MIFTNQKADSLGAMSSTLCLLHCIATPFIFIAQSSTLTCCTKAPTWWGFIDYFFLVVSFLAIHKTAKTTSSHWMKPALWFSWCLLFVVIINEKVTWFSFNENLIYVPAVALIVLHIYNRKYCQCNTNKCCIHER